MEQHVSWITQIVNHYLRGVALALLSALHIQPSHPEMPVPEHVAMGFFVLVVGSLLALFVRSRLSIERPGATQQIAELLLTNKEGFGISDILSENAGHNWKQYVPMVGTISIFILLANLFGVFPGFSSPTATVSVRPAISRSATPRLRSARSRKRASRTTQANGYSSNSRNP